MPSHILVVALPTPLRTTFDYLDNTDHPQPTQVGCRVGVMFGQRKLIGVVVETKSESKIDTERLRSILNCLDAQPLIPNSLLELCQWAANYYHHPLGEVIAAALPASLRQGDDGTLVYDSHFALTEEGSQLDPETLKRAPMRQQLLVLLQNHQQERLPPPNWADLKQQGYSKQQIDKLIEAGLLEKVAIKPEPPQLDNLLREPPLSPNAQQQAAIDQVECDRFGVWLLHGSTGSGKTEVYFHLIEKVLRLGKQALVLVPEIGLTPQTLSRFHHRFQCRIKAMHSGLNDSERKQAWLECAEGQVDILVGTRSAVFAPLQRLGAIIVDEEHDLSFKQQEGFRYSARDLCAIVAQKLKMPLILGSATPSLESLCNAAEGRYQKLSLTHRAGPSTAPSIELVDIKRQPLLNGFCEPVLAAVEETLSRGEQVLVFLNRRGYAPTLLCHDCGWIAQCSACDARLTVHHHPPHLRCHHCDQQRRLLQRCPNCQSSELIGLGQGTEQAEDFLQQRFEQHNVIRVDRDSTSRKHAMRDLMTHIHSGDPCILVGTQMLAKGHHFPNVTLVVILDVDSGLFSTDFRGPERMGQLLIQVAGRAGRAHKPGRVLIQTHMVDHPMLHTLLREGYGEFASKLLRERQLTDMPPYRYLVMLRAESKRPTNALELLKLARQCGESIMPPNPHLQYLGPLPAPMERRGDRYRFQLQIKSDNRAQLHHLVRQLVQQLDASAIARRTRWSVDIDPQEMN